MNSPEERRLKQHFEDLRAADQRSAPPFPGVLAAAESKAGPASRVGWIIAAAAVLTACLVLPLALRSRTEPASRLVESGAIATWSSPTAFLLETPGRRLL